MTHSEAPALDSAAPPGLGLLLRLKLTLLRNRAAQMINQSPLRLLLVILFVAVIWGALYTIFDNALVFMRRFEQSAVAIPYVFHIFFMAMTVLLAFSTAVLVYSALFSRPEPSFLIPTPNRPRNIVIVMYVEALFLSSWSLVLLGVPLMLAVGQVPGLPWYFYLTFVAAFLSFVPIPGAIGLLAAIAIALWLPRLARRTFFIAAATAILLAAGWWGRLWTASASDSAEWIQALLEEFELFKAALLPSTWVSNAIENAFEGRPEGAAFYLAVTASTALFFSWAAVNIGGRKLFLAFGRAQAAPTRTKAHSGWASHALTTLVFFYLPKKMRILILKDLRDFLRDPAQWSQLAILFGLLGLYLLYLPRARPEGFNISWQALICFLNFGAITLILSTFTSRFVFPLMSLEGRQMWLVGLWPMARSRVMWAKLLYAWTVTAFAALAVTVLSIRALQLPLTLGLVQVGGTLATCAGLCGLAIGLGATLPSYNESNSGRVASGLGGTVNLVASVALVTVSVGLFGGICYRLAGTGTLDALDRPSAALFLAVVLFGLGTTAVAMHVGIRSFRKQQF